MVCDLHNILNSPDKKNILSHTLSIPMDELCRYFYYVEKTGSWPENGPRH